MGKKKLQSAMEYLMTYGWAILVIALVLVALFYLGIFNTSGNNISTACVSTSGFVCANPAYSYATGNLVVQIGQRTGINWLSANIAFVTIGVSTSNPSALFNAGTENTVFSSTGIDNGGVGTVTLPVSGAVHAGDTAAGTIWVQYKTTAGGQFYYAQIASVNLKAS